MHYQVDLLFKQICEHISTNRKEHSVELNLALTQFINEHYADSSFSVTKISEKFNMNGTYLSRIFKEQTGYSPIDYLNEIRIQKSKELLLNKNSSIAEIAAKVGYNHVNTLLRAFKIHEGITPGQFREKL